MGRKRRRGRQAKRGGGGALTRMRGGFRSAAHTLTGTSKPQAVSRRRRVLTNVVTFVLMAAALAVVLRRLGVWR